MTEPDKGSYSSTYTLSSGEAAKAELRELREVADELVEALSAIEQCGYDAAYDKKESALARYEALRDG